MGKHKEKLKRFSYEKEVEPNPVVIDEVCAKNRKVKCCQKCCRYLECTGERPINFEDVDISRLAGAMVFSALEDYETTIPPISKCKTQGARERRRKKVYDKGTAENFFKSHIFHLMGLDIEYLRRAYEKAKIPTRRYRTTKNEDD